MSRFYLDSSYVVSLLVSEHPHHARSQACLGQQVSAGMQLVTSTHTLAETYATLTKVYGREGADVIEALELWRRGNLEVQPITLETYDRALVLAERLGVRGPPSFTTCFTASARMPPGLMKCGPSTPKTSRAYSPS